MVTMHGHPHGHRLSASARSDSKFTTKIILSRALGLGHSYGRQGRVHTTCKILLEMKQSYTRLYMY